MINFDEIDIKILKENFDEETINMVNSENLVKIYNYLIENNIYYAKDLILCYLNLFLLPANEFIYKFEKMKNKLGDNYIEKIAEDISLIETMY